VLVPPQLVKSLVRLLVPRPPKRPPESLLSRPHTGVLLETESVESLPGNLRRVLVQEEASLGGVVAISL